MLAIIAIVFIAPLAAGLLALVADGASEARLMRDIDLD